MLIKQTTSIKGLRAKNLPPPVPLFEDNKEQSPPKKGEFIKLDLHAVPGEANSDTCQLEVRFFNSGSPRQWIEFLKTFQKIVAGQDLSTGPSKCNMARTLLKGDALRAFNEAAITHGNETNPHFADCLAHVTKHVFPRQALRKQKRCFRCQLRKVKEHTMHQTVTLLCESNHDLCFCPGGSPASSLDEQELCEIIECIVPNTWQRTLLIQGFDITEHTLSESLDKLEQLETAESIYEEVHKGQNANAEQKPAQKTEGSQRNAKSSRRGNGNKSNGKRSRESLPRELWCPYHNHPHTMQECKVINAQVKAMKQQRDAQLPNPKRVKFSGNKAWTRKPDPDGQINAFEAKAAKKIYNKWKVQKTKKAAKAARVDSDSDSSDDELNHRMEKCSVDSSDSE